MPDSPLPNIRRLAAALALPVALAVLLLALAAPSRALARAHGSSCRHISTVHIKRHPSGCAKPRHTAKGHAHRSARRHAAAPAVSTSKGGTHMRTKVTGRSPAGASRLPARCEDGSAPLLVGDEMFECEDGSEPGCQAGSSVTISSEGSALVCATGPEGASIASEAGCEPASSPACSAGPLCTGAGDQRQSATSSSPPCEDGSEPSCEGDSTTAQPGSEPALACPVAGGEAGE
jgi:hypothetical protein